MSARVSSRALESDLTLHPEGQPYTAMAKALHWATVLLLILQFTIAWTMPEIHRGTPRVQLHDLHLSLGALILLVASVRLAWRAMHPAPPPPTGLPAWQLVASRVVHAALYVLLFAVPLLGWANASFRNWPVTLFEIVRLPALVAPREMQPPGSLIGAWTGDVHMWLSYLLIGLAVLHIAGALFHRFVLHDRVLARMLPQGWGLG